MESKGVYQFIGTGESGEVFHMVGTISFISSDRRHGGD
jgi:hypothetical protein